VGKRFVPPGKRASPPGRRIVEAETRKIDWVGMRTAAILPGVPRFVPPGARGKTRSGTGITRTAEARFARLEGIEPGGPSGRTMSGETGLPGRLPGTGM